MLANIFKRTSNLMALQTKEAKKPFRFNVHTKHNHWRETDILLEDRSSQGSKKNFDVGDRSQLHGDSRYVSRELQPSKIRFAIEAEREIRDRYAPWCPVIDGPKLLGTGNSCAIEHEVGGQACIFAGENTDLPGQQIFLAIRRNLDDQVSTTHHEIWMSLVVGLAWIR